MCVQFSLFSLHLPFSLYFWGFCFLAARLPFTSRYVTEWMPSPGITKKKTALAVVSNISAENLEQDCEQ
jgi:hypothetical protein